MLALLTPRQELVIYPVHTAGGAVAASLFSSGAKDDRPDAYDEAHYLAALQRRGSPLAAQLSPAAEIS